MSFDNHDTELKTLWVGDIEQWMDENYVSNLFSHLGDVANVKLIRDKSTMIPAGYGFVEFSSRAVAQRVMDTYNGMAIPGTNKTFRLNWASFGVTDKRPPGLNTGQSAVEYSVFVGDLSSDVTDVMLQALFASRYHSVRNAKVVTDPVTGASRGYGFVRFSDEAEKNRAMAEMQGVYCGARPIRTSSATPKKTGTSTPSNPGHGLLSHPPASSSQSADQNDPTNTTIFVGGLDPNVDEETLRSIFAPFGEMVYVKIPASKGCGFVQYVHRQCAESAFAIHGTYIGNQRVRLSWGRSPLVRSTSTPTTTSVTPASSYSTYYPSSSYGYDSSYYSTSYYSTPNPPKEKIIDFTLPPDINEMNEEYIENKEFQFTLPWFLRQHSGVIPDCDGPDSLVT